MNILSQYNVLYVIDFITEVKYKYNNFTIRIITNNKHKKKL